MARALNLTRARTRVQALLTDTVRLSRDAGLLTDDTLDEDTGELVEPAADATELWTGLAGVVPAPFSQPYPATNDHLTGQVLRQAYVGYLPLDAPPLLAGDLLTVLTATRDPQLAGVPFRVKNPGEVTTFAVVRVVDLVREDT